jgi:hypothetical protein
MYTEGGKLDIKRSHHSENGNFSKYISQKKIVDSFSGT